ncbi:HD domain-containing protein [Bordetella holmesii]|uniref:HD domain protein n=3 Tax=Bordetella holmesii TaxID=35814 RepID=A0A158M6H4_9BORD|nr:putative metal-dependent phosphohydrolase domain protein [Bordetella holmesii 44057]AMD44754.1 metal-dependent phosphohydrolase [Bordetella holmesii H558]AOB36854.1 metal-dependent phosphohydrolase [Bordetella holmesii]EWM42948.1 putative metal-dependent phosphohydrolase domain protein [Bordetella holmesii 41130]EWM46164.1 putative metal-dependent phosphohydrolase domain protein [Bordetella holmesii 35009]EWM50319.1 putative metal-dependent phosphohydrolase domain protein [Bordetella holmes
MNPAPLQGQLSFLREIDQLKRVLRQTTLIDASRRENSAEHSWHLALYALTLAEHAAAPVDVLRVVKMLLIHDIVEIDAGDTPFHDATAQAGQAEREQAAALRIFALLPPDQGEALYALWQEFEAGSSDDARFAKALDRLQPLLHNTATDGGTWNAARLNEAQVVARYGPVIERGAPALWAEAARQVRAHFHSSSFLKDAGRMLRIENLSKRYADHLVFEGLTHDFGPGCVALCEQDSTGKSTLLNIIAGVMTPDTGTVWIGGHDLAGEPQAARPRLAYVPDD